MTEASPEVGGPMDVLVVAGRFPVASETFVRQQIVDLVRGGHRVEVLALDDGADPWMSIELDAGVPQRTRHARINEPLARRAVRALPRWFDVASRSPGTALGAISPARGRRAVAGQLLAIASALGAPRRYGMIHCHFGPAGRVAVLARRAGIIEGPLGVGFYGHDVTREPIRRGPRVYAELFAEAELLLPHSMYLARRLEELGAPRDRVRLHRLGIDLDRFRPTERIGRRGPPIALAVGRFVEKKGFDVLLQAMGRIVDRSEVELRVIGDGPLRPELEAIVRAHRLERRVSLLGWRPFDAVAAAMEAADFLVAPSVTARDGDMEGLPLVVIEAMATGLPVIGSAHSGIPEIVEHGVTGLVTPERDVEALAEAILAMSDPEARRAFGASGRARIAAEFDSRRLVAVLCDLYRAAGSRRDASER